MSFKLYKPWTWFWGLLAGFISGGAFAVTSGPTAALFAPTEFNIKTPEGFRNLLWFMFIVFAQAGLGGAMLYLAKNPVPPLIESTSADTELLLKRESRQE